jgi:hypothetical protein
MNHGVTDTPEQVLKFAPKEKAANKSSQLDDAGEAIVAQIRTAADLVKDDCDRAMSLAHKLSMELRATEDRTHQMVAEVEHWRDRAARAEQWLRTILVALVRQLRRRRPKGGQRSLREISAELAMRGFMNERGNAFSAASISTML